MLLLALCCSLHYHYVVHYITIIFRHYYHNVVHDISIILLRRICCYYHYVVHYITIIFLQYYHNVVHDIILRRICCYYHYVVHYRLWYQTWGGGWGRRTRGWVVIKPEIFFFFVFLKIFWTLWIFICTPLGEFEKMKHVWKITSLGNRHAGWGGRVNCT